MNRYLSGALVVSRKLRGSSDIFFRRQLKMSMPSKDEHAALIGLPDRGRRVVALTKHSVVDSLIYGRDLDQSGEDPHRDFMQKLVSDGYAGEPSGHRDAKAANKKLCLVSNFRNLRPQKVHLPISGMLRYHKQFFYV